LARDPAADFVAQCLWFIRTQSFTLDEPGHIAAGLRPGSTDAFVMQNDNPPLARRLRPRRSIFSPMLT